MPFLSAVTLPFLTVATFVFVLTQSLALPSVTVKPAVLPELRLFFVKLSLGVTVSGSVVGSVVTGSVVTGSVVAGSVVTGSVVTGSVVVGSVVTGSVVTGSVVAGSVVKGSSPFVILNGRLRTPSSLENHIALDVRAEVLAVNGSLENL